MAYDLAIVGGRLVTGRTISETDIGVRGGKVVHLGRMPKRLRIHSRKVVDASRCLVIPGAVDPHVHFALTIGPGMTTADDFDTGTQAAAVGGVTTVLDYTTPEPGQRPVEAFHARRRQADRIVHVDYSLHNVLISWRLDWAEEVKRLVRLGAPSVKLFMIYRDRGWQADDGALVEVMECCRKEGLLVCVHAENDSLIDLCTRRAQILPRARRPGASGLSLARPPLVEEEAASRAITLAAATGARLHLVHLSTKKAAQLVGAARKKGIRVSAETCPQYLVLDQKLLSRPDGYLWGCCPPLRGESDRQGLLTALQHGWLAAVGTDHCAFSRAQKDSWQGDFRRIPYGLPGVETSLWLTYTLGPAREKYSIKHWVKIHSEGPARLFGLYPQKGTLQKGSDADVVIWDPNASCLLRANQLQTQCDWSPYEGMLVKGMARQVFLRGIEIAREGRYIGPGSEGVFVFRRSPTGSRPVGYSGMRRHNRR